MPQRLLQEKVHHRPFRDWSNIASGRIGDRIK
jgi:hypothetical protein